jgi:hypothetical protein
VDRSGFELCPVTVFGISNIELEDSVVTELVGWLVGWLVALLPVHCLYRPVNCGSSAQF